MADPTRSNPLTVGEPAPWFNAHSTSNPAYQFDSVAGRYVVLSFFGSASDDYARRMLEDIVRERKIFNDEHFAFFGVSADPEDLKQERVRELLPGVRFFWDFDGNIARQFGALRTTEGKAALTRHTLVLDERLRALALLPFDGRAEEHVPRLMKLLNSLPPLPGPQKAQVQAPILVVPRIFEPELCRALIQYYEERGGVPSGFMRDIDGKTVHVKDDNYKRRRDEDIQDEALRKACMVRIHDRLVPEIEKAYAFKATRIERYIVACYEAKDAGYFRMHRDNTTKGTAHRRFAVSLNLNTGEYEGGDLRFPEFGRQTYTPPAGGAVVFSCSLLHEATPVTTGRRFAFLPFLYDDAAARIREQNQHFLAERQETATS
jgi:peroxiredoxin/predicted 2-oxoglutarate/Fe(II)-dependent dioxygenase YbiX